MRKAYYHLPGLFEFYDLYAIFLPLFREHREYFYEWCEIGSIYGAPADCLWGGGRVGYGEASLQSVYALMKKYQVGARLTFSNSLLRKEHLSDTKCNRLCDLFMNTGGIQNGIIIYSDLLLSYLREHYPDYYYVSSTTKVLMEDSQLYAELQREEFRYVVPDFRWNKAWDFWKSLDGIYKDKVELLCNECCDPACQVRKACYETVSKKALGEACAEHICPFCVGKDGYRFTEAMKNPAFISIEDIQNIYMSMGFSHFKIEGRGLGSAMVLEFLLYYMTKPAYQLAVREAIYLDSMLDLF